MSMTGKPERIWIEQDDCPYFYEESELAEVGSPVTEYIRADLCHRPEPEVRRQALEEALQAIKSIPIPLYVETIYGHQDAYRAVEDLIIAEPAQGDTKLVDAAVREQALEEAAKLCDRGGAWDIADAIRALKSQPAPQTGGIRHGE